MDIEPLKDAYWEIVADCLREFHGYRPGAARAAALARRNEVENPVDPPPGYMRDLFYHEEAFYVACGVARRELPLAEHHSRYMRIMTERYAPADQLAFAAELRAAG